MIGACCECKFWSPGGDDGRGCCHRYPPVLNPASTSFQPSSTFLTVTEYQWCGEFRAKDEPQEGPGQ